MSCVSAGRVRGRNKTGCWLAWTGSVCSWPPQCLSFVKALCARGGASVLVWCRMMADLSFWWMYWWCLLSFSWWVLKFVVFHHCLHRGISNVSWICAQSICLYNFGRGHVGSGIGQWIWPFSFSSRACLGVRGPENRNQMMKTTFQSSCQLVVGLYGSQGVQPQRRIQVLESLESYVLQCVISKEYYQNSPRTHWESPG